MDDAELPTVSDRARLAVKAGGRTFPDVCQELYAYILMIPHEQDGGVDLKAWDAYRF